MTEPHDTSLEGEKEVFDRDLSARAVLLSLLGLAVTTAAVCVVVWWQAVYLRQSLVRQDPPPPVLPEARAAVVPPTPHLEVDPPRDLRRRVGAAERRLHGYGWVDRDHGIAHVPIDRAFDLLLERGLPVRPSEPPPEPRDGVAARHPITGSEPRPSPHDAAATRAAGGG